MEKENESRKTCCILELQECEVSSLECKDILEKQEQYLLKRDQEEYLGTVKRKELYYLPQAEEVFPHRSHQEESGAEVAWPP